MDEEKSPTNVFQEVLGIIEQVKIPRRGKKDLDYNEVVHQLEKALETLDEEMGKVQETTGMSKKEFETYTHDKKNFSTEEWHLLEQIKGQLEQYEERLDLSAPEKKEEEKEKPKRKRKRKGWMRG